MNFEAALLDEIDALKAERDDLLAEINALTTERDEARAQVAARARLDGLLQSAIAHDKARVLCAEAAKSLAKMQRWEFEALIAKLEAAAS